MFNKDFYITLVSNKNNQYYPNNTTGAFTTQLHRAFNLEGNWLVGLSEITFPNGFLHINKGEGIINIDLVNNNNFNINIETGVYPNTDSVIWSFNEDKNFIQHFELGYNTRTRFVTIIKKCIGKDCKKHKIKLTKKIANILGFTYQPEGLVFTEIRRVLKAKHQQAYYVGFRQLCMYIVILFLLILLVNLISKYFELCLLTLVIINTARR